MPYIGSRVKRKEDVRLLRGIGKYVDDIHRAGMVHAAILRSTHAHARIVKIDAAASMEPGAPQLHDPVPNNIAANFQVNVGDVDGAFRDSDLIVEEEFSTQRHSAMPLENRGLVAEWDEGRGLLTMWGPTKMTHTNWRILSELIGLPQSSIHFIEPEVGGGFGARGEFYPEDFLIPFAAMHFRKPICWIEDRSENLKAMNQSRQQNHRIKFGVKKD